MKERYFVRIVASSEGRLRELGQYGLDIFAQTGRRLGDDEVAIDGLLSLDEIGRLVDDGYEITVREPVDAMVRRRGRPAEDAEQWLEARRARRAAARKGE